MSLTRGLTEACSSSDSSPEKGADEVSLANCFRAKEGLERDVVAQLGLVSDSSQHLTIHLIRPRTSASLTTAPSDMKTRHNAFLDKAWLQAQHSSKFGHSKQCEAFPVFWL